MHWRPDLVLGSIQLGEDQEWAQELPEGSYRYPSRWLEERGSWLKDGKPQRSSLADIEDAEKFAKKLEADYCREEGYFQIVKSLEKQWKFYEHHVEIRAVEHHMCGQLGANENDLLPPKMRRKMQKAAEELKYHQQQKKSQEQKQKTKMKKWSNMQVF